jgi:hypothetical protein
VVQFSRLTAVLQRWRMGLGFLLLLLDAPGRVDGALAWYRLLDGLARSVAHWVPISLGLGLIVWDIATHRRHARKPSDHAESETSPVRRQRDLPMSNPSPNVGGSRSALAQRLRDELRAGEVLTRRIRTPIEEATRGVYTAEPSATEADVEAWEAEVGDLLHAWPRWQARFEAEVPPPSILALAVPSLAHPLKRHVDYRLEVLEGILRELGS